VRREKKFLRKTMPEIPMKSKYAGTCFKCKKSIEVGTNILYNTDTKKASHEKCTSTSKPPAKGRVEATPQRKKESTPKKQLTVRLPKKCHKCLNPFRPGELLVVTTTLTHKDCPEEAEPPF
jgi:hypothetical protein